MASKALVSKETTMAMTQCTASRTLLSCSSLRSSWQITQLSMATWVMLWEKRLLWGTEILCVRHRLSIKEEVTLWEYTQLRIVISMIASLMDQDLIISLFIRLYILMRWWEVFSLRLLMTLRLDLNKKFLCHRLMNSIESNHKRRCNYNNSKCNYNNSNNNSKLSKK